MHDVHLNNIYDRYAAWFGGFSSCCINISLREQRGFGIAGDGRDCYSLSLSYISKAVVVRWGRP